MVWPNNYRTFPGWNPNRLIGRLDYGAYKITRTGGRFNVFVNENRPQTFGTPVGYYSPAWLTPPIKAGALSSYLGITGEGDLAASVLAVRLAQASLTGSGDMTGTGSLIVQLLAAITGSGGVTAADLKAFLAAVAALSGTGGVSATATGLGALDGDISGSGALSSTLTGRGELSADIVSYGDLTIEGMRDAVWNAVAASYNTSGTMGEKMNDAGSAANPWTEVIESGYTAAEILRILASVAAGKSSGQPTAPVFRDLGDTKNRVSGTVDTNGNRTGVTIDET